jgi:hypothetical protein
MRALVENCLEAQSAKFVVPEQDSYLPALDQKAGMHTAEQPVYWVAGHIDG